MILAIIAPETEQFQNSNGELVARLEKALYGCIESAKRWYDELSSYLATIGFTTNPQTPCVFNKVISSSGTQLTIGLHVDDMLISCVDESAIDELYASIGKQVSWYHSTYRVKTIFLGYAARF